MGGANGLGGADFLELFPCPDAGGGASLDSSPFPIFLISFVRIEMVN